MSLHSVVIIGAEMICQLIPIDVEVVALTAAGIALITTSTDQ